MSEKGNTEKIGIIGLGVLGSVHKDWIEENRKDCKVLTYDINGKGNSTIAKIAKEASYIFLCLPTDSKEGRLDTSIIYEVVKEISENNDCVPIAIRSTLPIGYTEKLNKEFQNYIYFIPEFLTQRFAKEDFENCKRLIIGVPRIKEMKHMGLDIFLISEDLISYFPKSENTIHYVSYKAEAIKLFTNSFYALKIIFANEINDLCSKIGLSYKDIIEIMVLDERIGSSKDDTSGKDVHFRIAQDGLKGFGGRCLPKDTLELVNLMNEKECGYGLLQKVVEINNKLRNNYEENNTNDSCGSNACDIC
jgi:UDPglucose 6-dehydrogenase